MIVASIRRPNTTGSGHIIFVDASQGSDIIRVNATDKNTEHTQCTQAMFDPTGRYLMTALTSWDSGGRATDYGYRVYSSQVCVYAFIRCVRTCVDVGSSIAQSCY
jgi:hypothetical protein